MPVLIVENACLAFGHVPLLDHADFVLEPGERVGLIGRNGAGKSSLLKAIAGTIKLDDGIVRVSNSQRVAYVPQEPPLDPDATVFEAVAAGLGDLKQILTDYHAAAVAAEHDPAALERMMDLQHELEARDGWRLDSLVASTLTTLGLPAEKKVAELSGGWKKRVALAQALVSEPELLLLDEPTNHLDLSAIEWLEGLIRNFAGAVLLITHDRRFLDNVSNRIIELDRGRLSSFPGNFTIYQERKAEMLAQESVENAKFDKYLAQEEVWIRQGIKARRTRNEGRVRRLEQLRRDRAARRERVGNVQFSLDAGERSGKLVAELENVSKGYAGRTLIRDFTTRILRGDKIGLIGPNGAGKTTLLKLILGELAPDSGNVTQGSKQEIAYFDQFRSALPEDVAICDVISPGSDFVVIGNEKKHVISYLEDFLFAPERARSPVKSLSGGERARLLLARLFTQPANILVLDEPTNDLDIDTLELLEELLANYNGTVFLVSHDRTFLDNVVTQVIAFEGDGKLIENPGGYDDWIIARNRMLAAAKSPVKQETPKPAAPADRNNRPVKMSYKESQELGNLPKEIETLEHEQAGLQEKLLDPNIYRNAPLDAAAWQARIDEIDVLVLEKMARWEALEAKQLGAN
ncbi:ATP-binding cassette domain-containing protein [Chitinimonas sp. BJB300]|uniref:ATP-binding cassette domain-containing protein n=1 Tax=Chitinimonas sp. BJB300 TaxID=1559339 RepID=UPI000C10369B|nr:ATP-binding cassette domain-containing protein [Chitinimonas sp. BJB300]PHV13157.1 ABC transporter ATP-binding protein [Chitinimonas sp. BJB300]TSJ87138.1 ATP-binding cassette domain-containing protein [Chitinimonas sp. BJB300]